MDLLPNIQVDLIQEDPEPLEEENMSDEDITAEVKEIQEDIVPEVKERNIIPEEDIFVEKKTKKKAEPKTEPKKKRQMSEAQLERLRKGREKALANRRAKAQEKKEIKDLQDKKKKKDIQKLREEVEGKPVPESKPEPKPEPRRTITSLEDLPADMLVELQKRAIEGYDTKRKARKEEKKKKEMAQQSNTANIDLINNALKPKQPKQYGEAGFFNDCF
tara:strand:+ start:315 stop:968 length:654 start_codon:yes stop_codon:yes gene_type:complete